MFSSNSVGPQGPVTGQVAYTTAGTYTWVCPAGVTSVSVVCVGSGGVSNAGGLGWKNNISVTPGNSYTVVVQAPNGSHLNASYFISTSTVAGYNGERYYTASYTGTGGGNGGTGGFGGGGAGGYTGAGGAGANDGNGSGGSGGGGGGGGGTYVPDAAVIGGSGGGVGLLGRGSSGSGGSSSGGTYANGGGGGSGGANGQDRTIGQYGIPTTGGAYGGAGSYNRYAGDFPEEYPGTGGVGAVRIIWPGTTRTFPSTNTGNL